MACFHEYDDRTVGGFRRVGHGDAIGVYKLGQERAHADWTSNDVDYRSNELCLWWAASLERRRLFELLVVREYREHIWICAGFHFGNFHRSTFNPRFARGNNATSNSLLLHEFSRAAVGNSLSTNGAVRDAHEIPGFHNYLHEEEQARK